MPDNATLLTIANLIALGLSLVLNLWMFLATRSDTWRREMQQQLASLGNQLGATTSRLGVLEAKVEALPSEDDVKEIRQQLAHIDKSVGGLDERSIHTQRSVQRIEQYLLESRK